MFELTEKAKKVLSIAKEYAKIRNYGYIGTEHILYGLVAEGEGLASKILTAQNISPELIEKEIEKLVGISEVKDRRDPEFTPKAKRVIDNSLKESKKLGHNYIGTEHILISLMRELDSIAVRVLINLNMDPQKIFIELLKVINDDISSISNDSQISIQNNQIGLTPSLNQYGKDLTQMVRDGKVDPVIGREAETQRIIQILSRRTKNNPVLIGEPGTGKTAVVEGLAQKIAENNVPEVLKNKKVVSLDISSMVAGAKYRGDFEERLKQSLNEIKKAGNIIIFIDEMHTLVGAGNAEGAIDAANILKPLLARAEIQVIGATTLKEYKKHIEKDAALERRFQPIIVNEPTTNEAIEILKGIKDKYEAHHKVSITDEAIDAAVKLSERYINDRYLPDKAIDIIDEAASKIKLKTNTMPEELTNIEKQIDKMQKEKEEAIISQDFEKAAKLRDNEEKTKIKRDNIKLEWDKNIQNNGEAVTKEEVCAVISQWTGIPVTKISNEENEKLKNLDITLKKRVIGQDSAVESLARAIKRGRVGLKDPKRPVGSFLLLGPTGTGKTELTKALAESLFSDENAMIRLDMSEYMESHTVSKLIGSPPGYVGFEDGGQLTEKVRRKPYSIILFDEIEKAHPDIFNALLQILEDGRLTDGQGRTVNFKNTVIIMTSNAGAKNITEQKSFGFDAGENKEKTYEKMKSGVMEEVKRIFKPEFLNRIDDIIVFNQLDSESIKKIVIKMLNEVVNRVKQNGIEVNISDSVVEKIAKVGFDKTYGARPLRRAIQTMIEDKLAEHILDDKIKSGDTILIDLVNDEIDISKK